MRELKRELGLWGILGIACIVLGAVIIADIESVSLTLRWSLGTALLWAFVWRLSANRLHLNRPRDDAPTFATLGHANRLTLLRGFLIACTGGFLTLDDRAPWALWTPAFLYSVAAILDRVDGYVARRTSHTTAMGEALDTVFDALGLLIAPLLAVLMGKIHWSYLSVSFAYYLFHLGMRWRSLRGLSNHPLAPKPIRRTLAGFQMGYVAVVLWPPFSPSITVIAGTGFMLPLLVGFLVDWCVVSGRIDVGQANIQRRFATLERLSFLWLQPLLRAVCVAAALFLIGTQPTGAWWLTIALPSVLALLLGIGSRIAALALLLLLALQPIAAAGTAVMLLLFCSIGVMLLGGGRGSLWQGDDLWVERQDGAT